MERLNKSKLFPASGKLANQRSDEHLHCAPVLADANRTVQAQVSTNQQNGSILWLAVALILLSGLACRVEVGTGRAAAAHQAELPPSIPAGRSQAVASTETLDPPISSPPDAVSTPTPTLTPVPVAPTPTPTFTPTPVVPAQAPPDRILAPAIGLDASVVPADWTEVAGDGASTSAWIVPDDAAGWHKNSALPGHGGNVVLSGHHNLGTEVFRYLVDLQPGDEVILDADGRDYRYKVSDRFILPERGVSEEQRQQNAQWIMPTAAERLTLVTCWPYTDNSHRVIVVAEPVSG